MKILIRKYFTYFILLTLTLSLENCAVKKKNTTIKKEIIIKEKNEEISNKNILYIVDGKEVSSNFIESIDSNDIYSVTVMKGKDHIKEYTNKEYEGVIIIKMKKK